MRGRRLAIVLSVLAVGLAACNPPLAATPTAAPPPPPTTAPTAAPKPTAAPAVAQATTAPAAAAPTSAPTVAVKPADPLQPMIDKYYEAAKKEGKLVLYGVGNATLYNPVRDAFQKRFPGIELVGVDQRGRESREKVLAEQQSKNYVADVVISGTDTQAELITLGYTEQYAPADIGSIIPTLVPTGGQAVPRTLTVFTITVNTNLVPPDQEPKTWLDVLDPKWKGKLAMDDPRGSGPGGTILSGIEYLYGQDIDQKLAEQNPFFATQAGPIWEALDRGEYAIFLSSGHPDVIENRRNGAPVKQIKPTDGVGLTPINQALLKNAPHPNAAKLWLEWSLSEEGQNLLAQQGYAVVRQGIKATEPEADLTGVKFLPRDDDFSKLNLIPERTKRWESIFFKQ